MDPTAQLVPKKKFYEAFGSMLDAQDTDSISCTQDSELVVNGLHASETARFVIKVLVGMVDCRLSAIRRLSNAVYMDLNEIRGTRDFGSPQVTAFEDIDVERPSFLSTNHTAVIHFDKPSIHMDGNEVVLNYESSYPIHFRYQEPLTTLESIGHNAYRPADLHPLEGYLQCNDTKWRKLIPETMPIAHTCRIPVGKLSDAPLVLGGTLAVSVAAFAYILVAVLRLSNSRHIARQKQKDP